MTEQLALELEPPTPNPNAWMFNADGTPRKLMWCSDTVRIAWRRGEELPCPYPDRPPGGECCKEIERG